MNVELPTEDPSDNIGSIPLADGKGKANLFRLMCTFAIIESKVYKQLYSTKASKQSDGALLNTIGELDKELEDWKDSIPLDFRPENEIKASHTPLILHIVVLHFAYYNCLTTIHRMSVHHGYWSNRLSNYAIQGLNARPLNPRVFMSAALCVTAARASIHLIKYIPQGDYSCVWSVYTKRKCQTVLLTHYRLILYFPVSSLVTLFANILQNPQDARARSDVRLMNQVVNFLSILSVVDEQGGSGGVKRMLGVCADSQSCPREKRQGEFTTEKEEHYQGLDVRSYGSADTAEKSHAPNTKSEQHVCPNHQCLHTKLLRQRSQLPTLQPLSQRLLSCSPSRQQQRDAAPPRFLDTFRQRLRQHAQPWRRYPSGFRRERRHGAAVWSLDGFALQYGKLPATLRPAGFVADAHDLGMGLGGYDEYGLSVV